MCTKFLSNDFFYFNSDFHLVQFVKSMSKTKFKGIRTRSESNSFISRFVDTLSNLREAEKSRRSRSYKKPI